MGKKTNSIIFTLIMSLINIVFTLLLIAAMTAVVWFIIHLSGTDNASLYMSSLLICFIAGMLISMAYFGRFMDWVITKFNLEDKLGRIVPGKGKKGYRFNNENEKTSVKTNMPDSVKEKDDPWESEEK